MNAKLRRFTKGIALLLLLTAVHSASAFYDTHVGRWVNRDPLGELGFRLAVDSKQASFDASADDYSEKLNQILKEPGGPNLYGFVGNSPLNHTDSLGLLKFDGCSPEQQKELQDQLTLYCGKLKKSLTGCCLNERILPKLEYMCKNPDITIKCESSKTGRCDGPNTCGWSIPGGKTLHMCPDALGKVGICDDGFGCTLIHEMTHMIGHGGEKWPQQVEKCLGCKHWNGQ